MVKNTLDPICKGKSPKDIAELRIADIACGSGVFLEEAYQFIIDYCESGIWKIILIIFLKWKMVRKNCQLLISAKF